MIKVYHKCEKFPEGGKMTQYMEKLKEGDELQISYPFGKLNYQGKGQTIRKDLG